MTKPVTETVNTGHRTNRTRSSWRSECSQNGQISRSPSKRGLKPATTSSVRRFGTLVVAGFSPRSGSGHSPRYEARSLVFGPKKLPELGKGLS